MNGKFNLLLAGTLAFAGTLSAQNPLIGEAKQAWNGIKNNLIKMADKMPDDAYSFKASPDIRTFGELVGHVADSEMRTCSTLNGEMKNLGAGKMTAKADLVAAIKEASAACDKAFEGITDANAFEMVKAGRGQSSRIGALVRNTTHANEEYGYMAVYLRLKGVVPPSSEK